MKKSSKIKALAVGMLLSSGPVSPQNTVNFVDNAKQQIIKTLNQEKQDEGNTYHLQNTEKPHEQIITMKFDDILKLYGPEKGMEIIRKHFLIEVNKERTRIGSKSLVLNDTLNELSYEHSKEMADSNYFGHRDLKGNLPASRAIGRYKFKEFSENISYNTANIKDIVDSYIWSKTKNSGHYRLFEARFLEVGFGIVKSKKGIYVITVNYAVPK